jgi:hypothetical protein
MQNWLKTHAFEAHTLAFLLMILPPVGLYFTAGQGALGWSVALLSVVVLGNLFELFLK